MGTVAYMSPEQAQGLPLDHRSDIFTLGILLYEMATGERPFRGNTNMSVLSSILKDAPRPVSELRDDIPKPLARMIQRALEKRPEDRYQSTTDLRRDLEDLKRDVDTGEVMLGTTSGRRRLVAAVSGRRRWALPVATLRRRSSCSARWRRSSSEDAPPPPRTTAAARSRCSTSTTSRASPASTGCAPASPTCWSPTCRRRPSCACSAPSGSTRSSTRRGHRDDRSLSGDAVATVSRQAQASTALVGSFVRAGSRIRIQASLQDPRTGEVIASERVEGDAEERPLRAGRRPHHPHPQAPRDAVARALRGQDRQGEEAAGGHDRVGRGLQGLRRGQPASTSGCRSARRASTSRRRSKPIPASRWRSPSSRWSRPTWATSRPRASTRRRRSRAPSRCRRPSATTSRAGTTRSTRAPPRRRSRPTRRPWTRRPTTPRRATTWPRR